MLCPYCGSDSAVLDSRGHPEGVRRRRSCNDCKRRFTTYERLAEPNIKVVKRGGHSEPFASEKILAVLRRISRDRTTFADADVIRLTRAVEAELLDEQLKTVPSSELARRLLDRLRELDRLSFHRLAANYTDESGQLRTESRPSGVDPADQLGLFPDESGGDD